MPRGNISVSFRLHIHVGRNLWTRWRSNGGQALPLSERRYLDSLLPIGFVVSVGHLRSTRLWIIQLDDEWVRISSRIRFTRRVGGASRLFRECHTASIAPSFPISAPTRDWSAWPRCASMMFRALILMPRRRRVGEEYGKLNSPKSLGAFKTSCI